MQLPAHRLGSVQKPLYGGTWPGRMEDAVGNAVLPFHGYDLQQRMDIGPAGDGQQHIVGVFAAIEHIHAVKIEVHNMDLGMVLPQIVPQLIHIVAPAPVHQHQIFSIQISNLQFIFCGQTVVDGYGAVERAANQFQPGTAPQVQHGVIENAAYDVDVLAQVGKNLSCVLRGILKGNDLEFDVRVQGLHLGPQTHREAVPGS